MIYQNNYYYAGTTAIIYNFELDYPQLNFTQSNNGITEIGIRYKKQSDSEWNTSIKLSKDNISTLNYDNLIEPPEYNNNRQYINEEIINSADYLIDICKATNRIMPIRVVILNLDSNTTYNIQSYYIKNNITTTFNECSPTTLTPGNIHFECSSVGGNVTDTFKQKLKVHIDCACDIYNRMTAFNKETSGTDNVGSQNNGVFTATGVKNVGYAGQDDMSFSNYGIDVIVHEMAHNLMYIWSGGRIRGTNYRYEIPKYYYDGVDLNASLRQKAEAKITKFMEFATHSEGATWKWQDHHNYPVISSAQYNLVDNYLVAAACYVLRTCLDD